MIEEDILTLDDTREELNSGNFDNNKGRVRTGIGKHWLEEANKPNYLHWLHPISKALLVKLHFVKKQGEKICRKNLIYTGKGISKEELDQVHCEYCEMADSFDPNKKNRPYNALVMLAYVYDLVGKVITPKDDKGEPKRDKEGNIVKFDCNPISCLVLKRGKDDINITNLIDLEREGELQSYLFKITKFPKEAKKPMVAEVIAVKSQINQINAAFKGIGGCNVPSDISERFNDMSPKEVRGILVNCFNIAEEDWENNTLLRYVTKPKEDPKFSADGDVEQELDG